MVEVLKRIGFCLFLIIIAFAAGRAFAPTKTVTTTVRDEKYTQQKIDEYKQTHRDEFTVVKHETQTVVKPCPQVLVPDGTCKPPCATDCNRCPTQTISVTTDTEEHHDATTVTDGASHTTTQRQVHETTTKVETKSEGSKWSLSLGASTQLYDGSRLTLTPKLKFDASIGYQVWGPLWASVDIDTEKTVTGSLDLQLGDWLASAIAGTRYDRWTPFYGGALSRKLLGPVWVGIEATSNKEVEATVSLRVW